MQLHSLGQRIRELRLKKGITQVELAKGVCTPSMISQIESDRARPSYKVLFSLADRLDVPLENLLSDVDMNLEYVSTYKMSRAMVAAKEYASAIPLLQELLKMPRGQFATTDLLYELAECYLHTGHYDDAEEAMHQVREFAVLTKDHQLSASVLKNFAQIEFSRNRFQLAVFQWQRALEEVEKMETADTNLKASILFHLGRVYKTLGYLKQSIASYEQAAELFAATDHQEEVANVYLGLAMSYRKIGNLDRAAEYSEKAILLFENAQNTVTALQTQVHTAALHAQMGRTTEALPVLEKAILTFRDLANRDEEGIATVELAKLKLLDGDADEAEGLCERARNLLPEIHLYQGWISRVLGTIALQRRQREQAIKRFYKAADCFKQTQQVSEWDETMYDIARLHVEVHDLMRAYRILEDIRQYSRQVLEQRGIEL